MSWQERIWYGGSYYPLLENEENWSKDLGLMKEAGINFVRTAEICNSWDRLEPSKGHTEFTVLDRFFALCERLEMKVLLGTGTAAPPYWLHQLDPSVNIVSHQGRAFPNNATYGWACYNNPTFKSAARDYLTTLVQHYRHHEALLGYQINNEIGYPFMPLDDHGLSYYCYCDHCKAGFRTWLKEKYHTLEALTHAWSWTTTTTAHQDWEDVQPPYVKPAAWASVTRFLDWRLYQMSVMTQQVAWENTLIKTLDTTHPTVTNVFTLKSQDPLGVITAMDPFEIAKHVDVIGYDLYPGSGNKLKTKPHFSSYFFDHLRSVAQSQNIPYWLSEAEGGPIGGWVLGPDYNTKGVDLWRNQIEAVGHGVHAMLYQLFKEMPFQPLHWGGVIGLDSSKTSRFEAAANIGAWLKKDEAFLHQAQTHNTRIGLLMSRPNEIVLHGLNHEAFYLQEVHSIYRAYWEQGFTIDFLTPETFHQRAHEYALIQAPFMAVVEDPLAHDILTYIEQGGTFITAARFGYMDEKGWYQTHLPAGTISQTLGVRVLDCDVVAKPNIQYQTQTYQGHHHQESLSVDEQTQIQAVFEDGQPALIERPHGKGQWVYFATHLGPENTLFKPYLKTLLTRLELHPTLGIDTPSDVLNTLDVHHLTLAHEGRILITHFTQEPLDEVITLRLPFVVEEAYNVLKDTPIEWSVSAENTTLTLRFQASTFYVIGYRRKES